MKGMKMNLDSIRDILDRIDNQIDNLKDFPFIGSIIRELAAIVDPIRAEVDKLDPPKKK